MFLFTRLKLRIIFGYTLEYGEKSQWKQKLPIVFGTSGNKLMAARNKESAVKKKILYQN